MRPTAPNWAPTKPNQPPDAALSAPPSRKSSLTDNHAPNPIYGPPTTFFMATEEEVMGTTTSEARPSLSTSRRTSDKEARQALAARNKTQDSPSGDRRPSISEGQKGSIQNPTDSVYGVQSLVEPLGEAFGDKTEESKEEQQSEGPNGGLAALLGLKRRKTVTGADEKERIAVLKHTRNRSPESSRDLSPRDTHLHHQDNRTRQSSRPVTISQPLTPLQLESPTPNSAIPSTPKSGSFRSLHLSDEDEGTEDGSSQAIASSEEEEDYQHHHGKADMAGSVMPELVMPSLSMPVRRPFTARGKQMGRLKVCVAGPAGKNLHVYSNNHELKLMQELGRQVLFEPSSNNVRILYTSIP